MTTPENKQAYSPAEVLLGAATGVLWGVFFSVGLFPEETFWQLRMAGHVVSQHAAVNSPWIISFAWSAYLAWFTQYQCRRARLHPAERWDRVFQVFLVSLFAFIPMGLENFSDIFHNPDPAQRKLYLSIAVVKCSAWLYLFLLVMRHYVSSKPVFRTMRIIFPSARKHSPRKP